MYTNRRTLMSIGAGILGVALLVYFLTPLHAAYPLPGTKVSLETYAERIIATCSTDEYPPACYDKEIPKLMDAGLTMEDGFAVTSLIQNKVQGYYFCHVLGHELASKETAKDPTKWTEVIARCPVGQCSNGCLHGAAQERFRNDTLTPEQVTSVEPELSMTCESNGTRNYTGLEQGSCYHSLGHLSMYITGGDIRASVAVCDVIAKHGERDDRTLCYDGAFMQIFQPLEPEDFGLVRNIAPTTQGAAEKFCDTFTGAPRAACHEESWPLYRDSLQTSNGVVHFCSLVDTGSREKCYNGVFYILTALFNFDLSKIRPLCEGLPVDVKGQCFANAASRAIETDYRLAPKAMEICRAADTSGVGNRCYEELLFYSTYNYHVGSAQFNDFCKQFPTQWVDACMSGKHTLYPGTAATPNVYVHD
jgi:hypothetical protein